MGYAVNKDRDLCLQNSYTLARQAEQTYKSLIDAKLLDSSNPARIPPALAGGGIAINLYFSCSLTNSLV